MEVKANCFHSLGRVLGAPTRLVRAVEDVPVENADVWRLHERLFSSLGQVCRNQSSVLYLMEILRQPFEEIRGAVFVLLRAVAAQNSDWGMRALLSYGGFFEFLVNRTTEPTKETREWKFAVADAVVASPFHTKLGTSTVTLFASRARTSRVHSSSHCCSSVTVCVERRQRDARQAARVPASRAVRWRRASIDGSRSSVTCSTHAKTLAAARRDLSTRRADTRTRL